MVYGHTSKSSRSFSDSFIKQQPKSDHLAAPSRSADILDVLMNFNKSLRFIGSRFPLARPGHQPSSRMKTTTISQILPKQC